MGQKVVMGGAAPQSAYQILNTDRGVYYHLLRLFSYADMSDSLITSD